MPWLIWVILFSSLTLQLYLKSQLFYIITFERFCYLSMHVKSCYIFINVICYIGMHVKFCHIKCTQMITYVSMPQTSCMWWRSTLEGLKILNPPLSPTTSHLSYVISRGIADIVEPREEGSAISSPPFPASLLLGSLG